MRGGIFPPIAASVTAAILVFSILFAAQADDAAGKDEAAFSDNGVYIAPGASREVVIAGECRVLNNRDPMEPHVTETPCK